MTPLLRLAAGAALALSVGACSLGSLLGGGGKAPVVLYTLTPETPERTAAVKRAAAGESVTVEIPVIDKELRTTRVPVQVSDTQVQYVADLTWVDTPDRLFKTLLMETIARSTSRVVLDPDQVALDPGLVLSGKLSRFGFDSTTGEAVVRYEGMLAAPDGAHVETRMFESRVPADGTGAVTAAALNRAANQVAIEVAGWIGG
jgi:cholesterol transport system auxiliary component